MTDDDLDDVLGREEDIVPSSGFAAAVMEAVRREALAPPPFPFPWKRVLPGLAAAALALLGFLFLAVTEFHSGSAIPTDQFAPVLAAIVKGASDTGAGWIALALLLSFASVRLSMRLVGART